MKQQAGTDASAIFQQSPHSEEFLSRLLITGSLTSAPEIDASTVSSSMNNMDDDDDNEDHDEEESD